MGPGRLGLAELGDDAAALLARAFADDPVLTFLLGPDRDRERQLIFHALCGDAVRAGRVEGTRRDPPAWSRVLHRAGGMPAPAEP